MKRITFGPAAALLLLAGWPGGRADLINGGFETGDLTGWGTTTPGQVKVTSGGDPSTPGSRLPVEGSHFAVLSAHYQGSAPDLSRSITAAAGDVLRFSVFFDAGSDFANDTGYADLSGPINRPIDGPFTVPLISLSAGVIPSPEGDIPDSTPWTEVSYTFTTPGDYTLSFYLRNDHGALAGSAFGVDDVRLEKVPAPPRRGAGRHRGVPAVGRQPPPARGWSQASLDSVVHPSSLLRLRERPWQAIGCSTYQRTFET